MKKLLDRVARVGLPVSGGRNFVAFSGGVDSSVVAAAVHKVFPDNSSAVIGRSSALPVSQLRLAREVASHIGIELIEFETKEGGREQYLENNGMACYACKSELYSGLQGVVDFVSSSSSSLSPSLSSSSSLPLRLFNGTNRDDRADDTRVGLVAASEFAVESPIDHLHKDEVRALARAFGLPNHAHAASPCLRSRLALGVRATPERLALVERAEELVRTQLGVGVKDNLRVRVLRNRAARVEADSAVLERSADVLGALAIEIAGLGFVSVSFKDFRSGSVARN